MLVNGRPTFSCSTRVATANNRKIETIEGLSDGEKLHPVQEAFLAEGALQCGYCTTGHDHERGRAAAREAEADGG